MPTIHPVGIVLYLMFDMMLEICDYGYIRHINERNKDKTFREKINEIYQFWFNKICIIGLIHYTCYQIMDRMFINHIFIHIINFVISFITLFMLCSINCTNIKNYEVCRFWLDKICIGIIIVCSIYGLFEIKQFIFNFGITSVTFYLVCVLCKCFVNRMANNKRSKSLHPSS